MKKRQFAPSDFEYKNLPQTRRQQFFDLIKNRYTLLMGMGALMLLFALPLLITIAFNQSYTASIYQQLNSGTITEENYRNLFSSFTFYINFLYMADLLILSVGLSGTSYILRQLIWGEGVFFWKDFAKGVKKNVSSLLFNFFILGIAFSISSYCFTANTLIGIFTLIVFVIVFLPISLMYLAYTPIYGSNCLVSYRNSAILYFGNGFKVLLATIIVVTPLSVLLIPYVGIPLILLAILIVFLYPIILLGFNLFTSNIFDKAINSHKYEDLVRKGLYNPEKETVSNEILFLKTLDNKLIVNSKRFNNCSLEQITLVHPELFNYPSEKELGLINKYLISHNAENCKKYITFEEVNVKDTYLIKYVPNYMIIEVIEGKITIEDKVIKANESFILTKSCFNININSDGSKLRIAKSKKD